MGSCEASLEQEAAGARWGWGSWVTQPPGTHGVGQAFQLLPQHGGAISSHFAKKEQLPLTEILIRAEQ